MLEKIKSKYPSSLCLGLDHSQELLTYGAKKFSQINFIRADIQNLNFLKDETFDVLIATAVIEHLENPAAILQGSLRLLKKGGIIIITSPCPFWERISSALGLIVKEKHQNVLKLEKILSLCKKAGLNILQYKGFMLSPVGMIGELQIERMLVKMKLDKFLPNQLVVARKG
jgi:ubiquinone/menaquinone biosynthesis C-methylase UbiE